MHVLERAVSFNTFIISHHHHHHRRQWRVMMEWMRFREDFMIMGLGCYLHADYPLSEDRKERYMYLRYLKGTDIY